MKKFELLVASVQPDWSGYTGKLVEIDPTLAKQLIETIYRGYSNDSFLHEPNMDIAFTMAQQAIEPDINDPLVVVRFDDTYYILVR